MSRTLLQNCLIWKWNDTISLASDSPHKETIEGSASNGWILIDEDGRISVVGLSGTKDSEKPPCGEDIQVLDGCGQLIVPGLVDSHIHVAGFGESLSFVQLGECTSISKLQEKLITANVSSDSSSHDTFLVGTHWDQEKLGRYPNRHDLDAVCPDRPVLLWRACWHIVVCNTRALQLAGVLIKGGLNTLCSAFKVPEGGAVDLDSQGLPTGILRETAVELATAAIPLKSARALRKNIQEGLRRCVAVGLTTVQTNDERCVAVYKTLQNEDALPIRCFLTPVLAELGTQSTVVPGIEHKPDERYVSNDKEPQVELTPHRPVALQSDAPGCLWKADSKLVIERLKIFSDGALGSETAALRILSDVREVGIEVPTASAPTDQHKGILIHSKDALMHQIKSARAKGFRLEVHAIGDAAAELVLDCFEACGLTAADRPVLTHCQVLGADLIRRMSDLHCIANIQPSFVPTDMAWVQRRLSPDHLQFAYVWKKLLYTPGIVVAGGSDAPIETAAPLVGIYDAMFRKARDSSDVFKREECLTFSEALWLYTIGGAYACGMEHLLGRIEVGYAADLTFVLPDILTNPELLRSEDTVRRVFVGGKLVFDANMKNSNPAAGDVTLGGPFMPGKNGSRRVRHQFLGKCLCCEVR